MRLAMWLASVAVGAAWGAASEAAEPPSAAQQAIYEALLPRHAEPDCAAVDRLSPDPLRDLRFVVDNAQTPAWVPMRAAQCIVVRHAAEAEAEIGAWLVDPQRKGLAILAADGLDHVPAPLAERFAQKAVQGPWAAELRPRLGRCAHPGVRAVVR
jgi:hypothetical protein